MPEAHRLSEVFPAVWSCSSPGIGSFILPCSVCALQPLAPAVFPSLLWGKSKREEVPLLLRAWSLFLWDLDTAEVPGWKADLS